MATLEPVTHVDAGDVIILSHDSPHLIVSTARCCGCAHHLAEDASGWSVVLGDGDCLPSWAVLKADAA